MFLTEGLKVRILPAEHYSSSNQQESSLSKGDEKGHAERGPSSRKRPYILEETISPKYLRRGISTRGAPRCAPSRRALPIVSLRLRQRRLRF